MHILGVGLKFYLLLIQNKNEHVTYQIKVKFILHIHNNFKVAQTLVPEQLNNNRCYDSLFVGPTKMTFGLALRHNQ